MEIKPTISNIPRDTAEPGSKDSAAGNVRPLQTTVDRGDRVTLTNIAETLSGIESQLQTSDGIDRARVEQLRQSIEDGSYQVDVEKLVDKLLQTENELDK